MTKNINDNIAIELSNVSKGFKLPHHKHPASLKSFFIKPWKLFNRREISETQEALKTISLKVKKGEFLGIVGRNGSGKSTLLKIIANIYKPNSGIVKVNGKLVPFIELGVGFNPELTGRENVFLSGALMGFSDKEVQKKYERIVDFAELERFMDQKLKNYSSGMQVRLAFSVATILADSDILLIDEVLAVGDVNFQRKCYDFFQHVKKAGKTVVFVTHDMNAVEEFCDRAFVIKDGIIAQSGKSSDIANYYRKLNYNDSNKSLNKNKDHRWGDGSANIKEVKVNDKKPIQDHDKEIKILISVKYKKKLNNPITGIQIINNVGQIIYASNNRVLNKSTGVTNKNQIHIFEWRIPNILKTGQYHLTAAVHGFGGEPYDWWHNAVKFTINKDTETVALVDIGGTLSMKDSN